MRSNLVLLLLCSCASPVSLNVDGENTDALTPGYTLCQFDLDWDGVPAALGEEAMPLSTGIALTAGKAPAFWVLASDCVNDDGTIPQPTTLTVYDPRDIRKGLVPRALNVAADFGYTWVGGTQAAGGYRVIRMLKSGAVDCSDANAATGPNRPEIAANSSDDDCDGAIDEPSFSKCFVDADNDYIPAPPPAASGPVECSALGVVGNEGLTGCYYWIDSECPLMAQAKMSARVTYNESDVLAGIAFPTPRGTVLNYWAPNAPAEFGYDCDDTNALISPRKAELFDPVGAAVDNNCNGFVNETTPYTYTDTAEDTLPTVSTIVAKGNVHTVKLRINDPAAAAKLAGASAIHVDWQYRKITERASGIINNGTRFGAKKGVGNPSFDYDATTHVLSINLPEGQFEMYTVYDLWLIPLIGGKPVVAGTSFATTASTPKVTTMSFEDAADSQGGAVSSSRVLFVNLALNERERDVQGEVGYGGTFPGGTYYGMAITNLVWCGWFPVWVGRAVSRLYWGGAASAFWQGANAILNAHRAVTAETQIFYVEDGLGGAGETYFDPVLSLPSARRPADTGRILWPDGNGQHYAIFLGYDAGTDTIYQVSGNYSAGHGVGEGIHHDVSTINPATGRTLFVEWARVDEDGPVF